jgi:DNA-binding response OmpR family regulator
MQMPHEQLSVLLIDDEELVLETLGDYMEERGFKVLLANGGRQGWKCFFEKIRNSSSWI